MNEGNEQNEGLKQTLILDASNLSIDASKIDNAVLKRLIQEVQNDEIPGINGYTGFNRTHNRHNRGR